MEERGNKTIMCSVLFLDIAEYSKKSVTGQISLKDRFNSYLSEAIRDVPMTDRIILDTGDGAAINFIGDVEDALKAALSLRESLLNESPDVDHPLLVRMGINLGPVCLVRDINGQPNIVGDGINVAQRVMGFADAVQILVSRSYYDAVSRLSPQYAGMFHYQGSRTDKHVREHEVYAIGYPGDKTTYRGTIISEVGEADSNFLRVMQRAKIAWQAAATTLDALIDLMIIRFRQAGSRQRVLYVAAVGIPLLLFIALLANLAEHKPPALPTVIIEPAVKTAQTDLAITPAPVTAVTAGADIKTQNIVPPHSPTPPKIKKNMGSNAKKEESMDKPKSKDNIENNGTMVTSSGSANASISVICKEGTEVFIDGVRKGRVGSSPLTIVTPPGKHTVIVSHASRGIFTQSVELNRGKTMHLKPSLCN